MDVDSNDEADDSDNNDTPITTMVKENVVLSGVRRLDVNLEPEVAPKLLTQISYNHYGVLIMFKTMLFVETKPLFVKA